MPEVTATPIRSYLFHSAPPADNNLVVFGPLKSRLALGVVGFHILVVAVLRGGVAGALLSDACQLAVGVLAVWAALNASRVPVAYGRYRWRVVAGAFSIWCVGEILAFASDAFQLFGKPGPPVLSWYAAVLFELWFLPLALTLFVDPEEPFHGFDWIIVLDLIQAAVVLLAAFLFFFYIPFRDGTFSEDLAVSLRSPYFLLHAALIAVFALRGLLDSQAASRSFYRWITLYFCCSTAADMTYFYTPVHDIPSGGWFDPVWSALLVIPVLAAAYWETHAEAAEVSEPHSPLLRTLTTQIFPLLYPLLVLTLGSNLNLAHQQEAFFVVLFSYTCLSVRLLTTHYRLVNFQRSLEHRASHDALTGLWNRGAILDFLRREAQRAQRNHSSVAVVMLDLDHFKALNDEHGHLAGDRVLEHLAAGLKQIARPYDAVGRYGGEEFLLVLPDCSPQQGLAFAERVRQSIENSVADFHTVPIRYTASMGVALVRNPSDVITAVRAADNALYVAKSLGRNRVELAPSIIDDLGHNIEPVPVKPPQ